jgi:hypothetical protein
MGCAHCPDRIQMRQEEVQMGLFQPRDPFRELRKSPRHEIHYLAHIDVEGRPAPLSCII